MIRSRIAKLSDISALHTLVNSAYRGESSHQGWTTEDELVGGQRTDPDTLRTLLEDTQKTVLVIFEENQPNEILGCVLLEFLDSYAYLGMLTVKPNLQARGLGRALLGFAEAETKTRGYSQIKMSVIRERQSLLDWYFRRGYQLTGETKPFPYGDERFGIPKVSNLEFLILQKGI